MNGPLLRPRFDRKVAGVCAAFARAYGWDLTLVRIAVVVISFFAAIILGPLIYLVCWVVIPEEPAGNAYPAATYGGVPTQYPPQQYPPYTSAPPPPPYPPSDQPPTA